MPKKIHRQVQIRNLLALRERLGVEELAEKLDVTPMTIRRDLVDMENQGELIRTHGGCALRSVLVSEGLVAHTEDAIRRGKYGIAREVVLQIGQNATIYLHTGMAAVYVARLLPNDRGIRVLTNHLHVAMELFARKEEKGGGECGGEGGSIEVIVLGGELVTKTGSSTKRSKTTEGPSLVGEMALLRIAEFHVDFAIFDADAVDPKRGEFYSDSIPAAALARAAQAKAKHTIVMADHSTFGKTSLMLQGQLGPSVTLVTDRDLPFYDRQSIEATGANVVVAK